MRQSTVSTSLLEGQVILYASTCGVRPLNVKPSSLKVGSCMPAPRGLRRAAFALFLAVSTLTALDAGADERKEITLAERTFGDQKVKAIQFEEEFGDFVSDFRA